MESGHIRMSLTISKRRIDKAMMDLPELRLLLGFFPLSTIPYVAAASLTTGRSKIDSAYLVASAEGRRNAPPISTASASSPRPWREKLHLRCRVMCPR